MDLTAIVDKLLDMEPDPIPKFVLLKEFKGYSPENTEYQNAYDRVCSHAFIQRYEESQNDKGFWPSFHGDTEGVIRHLLSYGLDKNHFLLKRVKEYILKLLHNEESPDRFEKQDNIRWWPEIFMPLACAATLALIDNTDENLDLHRQRWAVFAETSLKKEYNYVIDSKDKNKHSNFFAAASEKKYYDYEADRKAQNEYFGFKTNRIIPPFNYYNFLLLSPHNGINYLNDDTDQTLIDYCMNEADGIYYIYNKRLDKMIPINSQNGGNKDFCHWVRALSLLSHFKGWDKYEPKYFDWILEQKNQDGLWEFSKKYDFFALSNLWKGKNKVIDSTIYVLRFLMKKQAY